LVRALCGGNMITRRDLMVACFAICCTLGVIALAAETSPVDVSRGGMEIVGNARAVDSLMQIKS